MKLSSFLLLTALSISTARAQDLSVLVSSNMTVTTVSIPPYALVITQSFNLYTNQPEFTPNTIPGLRFFWADDHWDEWFGDAVNTPDGYYFDGSHWLESTNADVGGTGGLANSTYWFLVQPELPFGGLTRQILSGVNNYGFGWDPWVGGRFYHGAWVWCYEPFPPQQQWMDLCVVSSVVDSWFYANGELVKYNQVSCGEVPNDAMWRYLGRNFKGYIQAVAVYTNAITTNDVFQLHQYAHKRIQNQ